VDGVKGPKTGRNKFFFEMKVLENKALLPARLRKVAKQLEDYPFAGLEVRGLAGTVEKSGEGYLFTARASDQKYQLKASDEVRKLFEGGKKSLTLAGLVTQKEDKDPVTLEVTEAKETAK
jgi:hypothetical protein